MIDTLKQSTNPATDPCDGARDTPNDDVLIARHIEPGPLDRGPYDARIIDHGAPVWNLIAHHHCTGSNVARTASDYGLSPEAMDAAIRYYCRHRAVIDARILLNRSFFGS